MRDLLDVLFEFKKYFRTHITDDLNKIVDLKEGFQASALTNLKDKYKEHLIFLLDTCDWEDPRESVREEYKDEFCEAYVEGTFNEYTEDLNTYMRNLRKESKEGC